MDLVVVVKLNTALIKMLDPVETSVLNFQRKILLHSTALKVGCEYTRYV